MVTVVRTGVDERSLRHQRMDRTGIDERLLRHPTACSETVKKRRSYTFEVFDISTRQHKVVSSTGMRNVNDGSTSVAKAVMTTVDHVLQNPPLPSSNPFDSVQ